MRCISREKHNILNLVHYKCETFYTNCNQENTSLFFLNGKAITLYAPIIFICFAANLSMIKIFWWISNFCHKLTLTNHGCLQKGRMRQETTAVRRWSITWLVQARYTSTCRGVFPPWLVVTLKILISHRQRQHLIF